MGGLPPKAPAARQILWSISEASMDALRKAARLEFVRRLVRDLGRDFPEERSRLGARLTSTVEQGLAEGAQHGIAGDDELEEYLRLWFGSGFDLLRGRPGGAQVLADGKLSARAKIDLLQQLGS